MTDAATGTLEAVLTAERYGYAPADLDAMPAAIELNPRMVETAEANRRALGYSHVEFRPGRIEEGEFFELFERAGFKRIRSRVVAGFQIRKASTQDAAEQFGVKAVVFTALRPAS